MCLGATVGVTSAFAIDEEVVFCKQAQLLCPSISIYPAGTPLKLLASKFRFLGSPEVECEHFESNGETLQSMAKELEVEMKSASISGCNVCSAVDVEGFPRRYTFWMTAAGYWIDFGIKFTLLGCGSSKLSCQYAGELIELPVENKETGQPVIPVSKAVIPFVGGTGGEAFCGKSTTWDATVTASTNGPLWFSLYLL
jgi:hypothetical protein